MPAATSKRDTNKPKKSISHEVEKIKKNSGFKAVLHLDKNIKVRT